MVQSALARCPAEGAPTVTELVEQNLPLVGQLVRARLCSVPSHVSRDELISAGMMALVLSAQHYDPARGVPFARYAAFRIRGALTDELRSMDWATRSVRSRAREFETVRGELAGVLERNPRTEEVAEVMHVNVHELTTLQSDVARASVLSLQGFPSGSTADVASENSEGPESLILMRERLGYLHDAIAELSERLRFVVDAYFFEQRQMSEIAEDLGVTQSRVSQLCAEALYLLRDGINSQLDPSELDQRRQTGRVAATRKAYFCAIADRGTLSSRLAMSTLRGDMLRGGCTGRVKIA